MFARTILVAVAMASAVQAQSTTCAACAVLLALSEQLSGNYSSNPDVECKTLGYCSGECTLFNGTWPAASPYWPTDGGVVDTRRLSSEVEGGVDKPSAADFTADAVHQYLKAVKAMEATQGSMTFTELITGFARSLSSGVLSAEKLARLGRGVSGWTSGNGTDNPCDGGLDITCDINRVFDLHLPLTDGDNDTFAGSDAGSFLNDHFRGADWRGKDCNDSDSNIYPGRQTDAYPPTVDHNCNGIFGVDQSSGQPYEQLYCSGSNAPMGLAILGDSAAAHFHLPPQYLNARSFNWSGVLELAANEADWPQCESRTRVVASHACLLVLRGSIPTPCCTAAWYGDCCYSYHQPHHLHHLPSTDPSASPPFTLPVSLTVYAFVCIVQAPGQPASATHPTAQPSASSQTRQHRASTAGW